MNAFNILNVLILFVIDNVQSTTKQSSIHAPRATPCYVNYAPFVLESLITAYECDLFMHDCV